MGDPFTDVAVSNYDSNPPSDDGSQTEANRVKYSTTKAKLADPLKTALEELVTNTGTAFDKVSGNYRTTAISYQVVSADQGRLIRASASGITITTPDATDVGSPFFFAVKNNSSGDITVDGSGAQTIDGSASVTLPKTRGLMLYTDGANWFSAGLNWHTEIIPGPFITPKGRLTLTTAVPVLISDVTGATTVFYTPYQGNTIMLPDASGDWGMFEFAEVSQALSDNTKSPAAALADNLYDMFGWMDGTTFRATRGPAWTSATGRGTGAGTTELTLLDGVAVNANAISNGPGASRGVYLGTIATNGSNQLNVMLAPNAAAGGSANRIDVWNNFNRVEFASVCRDSTDSWNYTLGTWRSKNNNTANRLTFVRGLNEDPVVVHNILLATTSGTAVEIRSGIGLDATNAIAAGSIPGIAILRDSGRLISVTAFFGGVAGLGRHFIQALENSEAASTTTWYGDNADATLYQSGLIVRGRY